MAMALLAARSIQAQIVLFDDFDDGTLNPSLWSVELPFSQSRVVEGGNVLTTTGRGTLVTASGFSGALTISGTITLNHHWENFQVCMRTDLAPFNEYWERMGVIIDFHNAYDVQFQGVPGLALATHTPTGSTTLASSSFTLNQGRPYDFEILDTGYSVTLSVNGVEMLSAATAYAAGDRLAFFSREFDETSSSLDYVSVTVVPEPSGLKLIFLVMLVALYKFAGFTPWQN